MGHNENTRFLHRAALLALRGHGHVEPNPMVGCIITDARGDVVGMGHHDRFGGAHAEIHALRSAGGRARGGSMYVTLEPCDHHGKTPPCTDAIISAGIARVVFAQHDPSSPGGGGAQRLRASGVEVVPNEQSALANDVSAPFRHRVTTGLPWVVAKWAQTLDGAISTPPGAPRWISNFVSRRMVHRERGRVDAILTGMGTVRSDDPLLTARGVPVRRRARRIILDPACEIEPNHQIIATAAQHPTTIICNTHALTARDRKWLLDRKDIEVLAYGAHERLPLRIVLQDLARRYELTTLLVEAGEGVLHSLFSEGLINQAWVFVGEGAHPVQQAVESSIEFMTRLVGARPPLFAQWARRRQNDLVILYRINAPAESRTGG